jgi:hypothetical protein
MSSTEYYLLWKGRQSGPFSLTAIREQLVAGDINRMHQVSVGGRWIVLADFLDQQDGGPMAARRRAQDAARKITTAPRETPRRESAARPGVEPTPQNTLEKRSPLSHLLPPQTSFETSPTPSPAEPSYAPLPPPPPPPVTDHPAAHNSTDPFAVFVPPNSAPRTSSLAIASLILGICNFIPYVCLATWPAAIFTGHLALSRMKQDPMLGGRGLALAGLIITYSLLGIGVVIGLVYRLTTGHAPHLNFP